MVNLGDAGAPPRDFRSLRDLMVSRKDQLPKRLAQVAAFAMANPDEIAFGTAASIAEKAMVQPSTLVRFAQAFGYQGFSDLQSIFRERIRDRISNYDDRLQSLRSHIDAESRSGVLLEGFCKAASRSVEVLRERVTADQIEAAARCLARAETIYLVAQRRSFPVTTYMSYAFGKLGIKSVLIGSAAGTDPETLAFAGPQDAAIAVSFTPYASSTLAHVRQLADRGTPTVVITDSPFSPLLSGNRIWFEVVESDYEGFRPLAATMALAMTLAVAVAEERRAAGAGINGPNTNGPNTNGTNILD